MGFGVERSIFARRRERRGLGSLLGSNTRDIIVIMCYIAVQTGGISCSSGA